MVGEKLKLPLRAIGFVVFALLFQAAAGPLHLKPEGFISLEWQDRPSCAAGLESAAGECLSRPFSFKGTALGIWLKGAVSAPGAQGAVLRRADSLDPIETLYLAPGQVFEGGHNHFRFETSELRRGGQFVLQIFDQTAEGTISVRSRAEIETAPELLRRISNLATGTAARLLICLFGAVLLSKALCSPLLRRIPVWAAVSACSMVLFYRPVLYYYWDEWYVLQRFSSVGIAKILEPHNEHFLPLFFLFYYALVNLFSASYALLLIVSALVHGFNCLLLERFLARVFKLVNGEESSAPRFLAVMFGISALHPEVLQWAFELSVLLSFTCSMLLLLAAMSYLETRRNLILPAIFALSAACPLTFGNGFSVFGLVLLVALLWRIDAPKRSIAPALSAVAVSGLGFALAALLYKSYAPQGAAAAALNVATLKAVISYVWVGTQLGTVLRGLAMFPALELEAAQAVVPMRLARHAAPEVWIAGVGFCVSLVLLGAGVRCSKRPQTALKLWLFGLLISASALVLPALGRVQLGVFQSLALRYQYLSLVGLAVMLLPFAHVSLRSGAQSTLKCLVFIAFLTVQLFTICRFDYFSLNGSATKAFLETLREWDRLSPDSRKACCEPEMPPTVTPVQTSTDIERTMRWLEGR